MVEYWVFCPWCGRPFLVRVPAGGGPSGVALGRAVRVHVGQHFD